MGSQQRDHALGAFSSVLRVPFRVLTNILNCFDILGAGIFKKWLRSRAGSRQGMGTCQHASRSSRSAEMAATTGWTTWATSLTSPSCPTRCPPATPRNQCRPAAHHGHMLACAFSGWDQHLTCRFHRIRNCAGDVLSLPFLQGGQRDRTPSVGSSCGMA